MSRDILNASLILSEEQRSALIAAARAATTKAFLTKEGGVRYGAAVLTSSGEIFSSGQYSSFNHSMNVHAEHAALILATMAGTPDVVALAVSSTRGSSYTRPCGICRQTMIEHAGRTKRDFLVLMVNAEGECDEALVSGLLPYSWSSATEQRNHTEITRDERRTETLGSGSTQPLFGSNLHAGDQVYVKDQMLAIVWDPNPWPSGVLGKIKYVTTGDGGFRKLAHAFSQAFYYEQELQRVENWKRPLCGSTTASLHREDVTQLFPAQPYVVESPIFSACLEESGLSGQVFLGGSRALGLEAENSDHDLIIRGRLDQLQNLRSMLSKRIQEGLIRPSPGSNTWRILSSIFPAGREGIVEEGRFAETFMEGEFRYSLMLSEEGDLPLIHDDEAEPMGHRAVAGRVVSADRSLLKRAQFTIAPFEDETKRWEVICFHKTANMIREGDKVAARGWLVVKEGKPLLLQFHTWNDNIVWIA